MFSWIAIFWITSKERENIFEYPLNYCWRYYCTSSFSNLPTKNWWIYILKIKRKEILEYSKSLCRERIWMFKHCDCLQKSTHTNNLIYEIAALEFFNVNSSKINKTCIGKKTVFSSILINILLLLFCLVSIFVKLANYIYIQIAMSHNQISNSLIIIIALPWKFNGWTRHTLRSVSQRLLKIRQHIKRSESEQQENWVCKTIKNSWPKAT